MSRAVVFLNGDAPSEKLLSRVNADDYLVCADGAYKYLKGKFIPDVLLGDYDSLGEIPSESCAKEVRVYSTKKDYSDGHLAVECAIEKGVSELLILGAFGGRVDHFYANISLLYQARLSGVDATILGEDCQILLVDGKVEKKVEIGSIVSLVPFFDKSHIISTKGLSYEGDGITLQRANSSHGISNEATCEDISVSVDGLTLMFITRAEER